MSPEEFAMKVRARQALGRAVRRGQVVRPDACEACGSGLPEAHHDDYEHPLAVRWLCRGCHVALHCRLRGPRRAPLYVQSIRIERDRLDAFKAVADHNRRSVSQEMRCADRSAHRRTPEAGGRMNPLTDRLRGLKDGSVPWDAAWLHATNANRGAYFYPTLLDDGISHPCGVDAHRPHACGSEHGEPASRFQYRVLRAAYLDVGRALTLSDDREAMAA